MCCGCVIISIVLWLWLCNKACGVVCLTVSIVLFVNNKCIVVLWLCNIKCSVVKCLCNNNLSRFIFTRLVYFILAVTGYYFGTN